MKQGAAARQGFPLSAAAHPRSTVAGDGETRTTGYTYDFGGRQLTSSVPGAAGNIVTTNHYDALGRVDSVTVNGIAVQSVAYDNEGRRATETDAEGDATHWGYDSQGRQTDWWFDWDGSTTSHMHFRFKFDGFGNQTAFADGNGTTRTKVYDDLGRLAREYSPALTATNGALAAGDRMVKAYQYDGRGRVRTVVEGKVHAPAPEDATLTAAISDARTATTTFDPVAGAATQIAYSDGRTEKHFYDPDDGSLQRVEIWKAGVLAWQRTIAYDEERRTATVATPEGTVGYQYNEYGELTELKTSWGQTTDYQYDCFGRMTAVSSNKLGTSGGVVRYAYDPATGRKSDVTRPNGVTTHYTYDALGNVHIIDHANGSTHLLTLTYTRDNRGIITALEESRDDGASVVDWTYAYDGAKRLTGADRAITGGGTDVYAYTYDDAGNRLTKSKTGDGTTSYTYNEIGQMLSDGTTTYLYDAYGNLEYEKQGSETERQYYWDGENHLLKVDLYASGSLVRTVAMSYDDQGGRVGRKQTAGATVEADNRYLTDYGNPTGYSQVLEQLDASATSAEKDFIYGADLLAQSTSGVVAFLQSDHLGSTRLLTDAAGGAITDTAFDYSPVGDPLGTPGSSLTDYPHAFTGQWRDPQLEFQFHRSRWIGLSSGLWLAADSRFDWPLNFGSKYSATSLDPVNTTDPSGTNTIAEEGLLSGMIMNLVTISLKVVSSISALGAGLATVAGGFSFQTTLWYTILVLSAAFSAYVATQLINASVVTGTTISLPNGHHWGENLDLSRPDIIQWLRDLVEAGKVAISAAATADAVKSLPWIFVHFTNPEQGANILAKQEIWHSAREGAVFLAPVAYLLFSRSKIGELIFPSTSDKASTDAAFFVLVNMTAYVEEGWNPALNTRPVLGSNGGIETLFYGDISLDKFDSGGIPVLLGAGPTLL